MACYKFLYCLNNIELILFSGDCICSLVTISVCYQIQKITRFSIWTEA